MKACPCFKKKKKLASFLHLSDLETSPDLLVWLFGLANSKKLVLSVEGKAIEPQEVTGVGQQNSKHASADWSLAYSWGWQAKCNDSASITYRGGDGFKNWVLLNPCHSCQEQQKGYSRERWLISAVNTPGLMTGLRWWFVPCALRFIPAIDFKICS